MQYIIINNDAVVNKFNLRRACIPLIRFINDLKKMSANHIWSNFA